MNRAIGLSLSISLALMQGGAFGQSASTSDHSSGVSNTSAAAKPNTPGDHIVRVSKPGYSSYERKLHTSSGAINLNAQLTTQSSTSSANVAYDPGGDTAGGVPNALSSNQSLGEAAREAKARKGNQ